MTPLKPCGTAAAYRRHLRHEEEACEPCKQAHARTLTENPRNRQPCGTPAAYRRHLKHNEETCDACREAWATRARSNRRTTDS